MLTLIGVFIIIFPLTALLFFKDKITGFFYIITSVFTFHFTTVFLLQYFEIFTYKNLLTFSLLAVCSISVLFFKFKDKINLFKPSVYFIIVFSLIFIQLWSVHYHYSGVVQTINGWEQVENSSYAYPKFSDEWVAASLMEYSIESKKLPFVNPFSENVYQKNLLFPFHTIFAGFFLILNISPVTNFSILPVILGMLICFAVWGLLITLGLKKSTALIATLFVPMITQSGNLPGIWFAIPYIVGLLFLVTATAGFVIKDKYLYITSSILSLLFYPPIIIFLLPMVFVYFWIEKQGKILIFISFVLSIIIFFNPYFLSKILRPNVDGGIISLPIIHIVPIILFPFILIGLYKLYKKDLYFLLAPVTVGLLYWILYSFYGKVIIIEYVRVVMITSVLLVILAGIGLSVIEDRFSKKIVNCIIVVFLVITIYYPIGNPWKNFITTSFNKKIHIPILPTAPISRYVNSDDLKLFKNINNEVFIAPPWKGLVLASLTNNIPLETKPSAITVYRLLYKNFINKTCEEKQALINKYNIKYIYSVYSYCDYLELVGTSSEGLNLYKYIKPN